MLAGCKLNNFQNVMPLRYRRVVLQKIIVANRRSDAVSYNAQEPLLNGFGLDSGLILSRCDLLEDYDSTIKSPD